MSSLQEFATAELPDKDIVAEAERRGFTIHKPRPQSQTVDFDLSRIRGDRVRLAIVSDTHFGSKYQQPTHLRAFYRYAKRCKVDAVIGGGDLTDGPMEMHKGSVHEKFLQTYDAQREYVGATLPDIGVEQFWISGNHDDSYLKNAGGDIVADICGRRDDLTYIGRSHGYVRFGDILVMVTHPHKGGAYALSYTMQNMIRDLSPENKPHFLFVGNFHKPCYLPAYRNIEAYQLPSYQSQTGWMASKGIPSIVGGLIVEFGIVPSGLAPSVKTEWVIQRVPNENDF